MLDACDNLWLAGTRQSEVTGRQDCVLWQVSSDGYLLRRIYYDSSPSLYDESVHIAADPFGSVVLAANSGYLTSGYTTTGAASDILLLKYGLVSGLTLHGRVHLGDVAMYPLVVPVEVELRRYGQVVWQESVPVDEEGRFILYNAPQGVWCRR